MKKRDENFIPGCPIRFSADIFGDRWTMIILRDLLFRGFRHYGQFLTSGEGISTNILADRLARLERSGIVTKSHDPEKRSRRIYSLTERGKSLRQVFFVIMDWAVETDPKSGVDKAFIERLRKNFKLS